jgi:hypothetical protein
MLTSLDCWYQARVAFAHGHWDRAIEVAEAAQTIIDETTDMKRDYPPPVVPDHLWEDEAKAA